MPTDSGPPQPPPYPGQPPMAEAEPSASPPPSRPGWIGWAIGLGVVVVAVGAFLVTKSIAGSGGSSPAAATTNGSTPNGGFGENGGFQGRIPGTSGQITAIDGSTLTVKDRQGNSVKVTTNSSTRFTVAKTVAVSDIAKGDRISATGKESGTTVAATSITIMNAQQGSRGGFPGGGNGGPEGRFNGQGPPGGFNGQGTPPSTDSNGNQTGGNGNANRRALGGFAFGTVTGVNGSTITISSFNGSTMTVTTTSSTKVTKSVSGSISDLKVGDNIRAIGTTGSDGTVAAASVSEGNGGFGFFGGGRRGQGTP